MGDRISISRRDLISMKVALEVQLEAINNMLKDCSDATITPRQVKKQQLDLASQRAVEKRLKRIGLNKKP